MRFQYSKYCRCFSVVVIFCLFFPIDAHSDNDPWIGTFIAKDNSNYFSIIKKLTFTKGTAHAYSVEMEISRFLNADDKKIGTITGYAEIFSPDDDKTAPERMFVYFPRTKFSPFLEIIPGRKSTPVRNAKGFVSLHYTYFEKAKWRSYVADELIRAAKVEPQQPHR